MLNVVVLAAGQGKRMRSDCPKVLHKLAGKPLLAHVLAAARSLQPVSLTVVVGHGGQLVCEQMAANDVQFAWQHEQKGTGHALKQALPLINANAEQTLVLSGDVPLIQSETLLRLLNQQSAEPHSMAILTLSLSNPTGYGRIVRDSSGKVVGIVEEKDASADEKKIREINTGIMVLPTERLSDWLSKLDCGNAQGEFYLTDVVQQAVAEQLAVVTENPAQAWEADGVNNPLQLATLERTWQQEQARRLLLDGLHLADPARFDLRGTLRHGRDVFIDVGVICEGEVVLGDAVNIGAHCVLKNVRIESGAKIEAFCHVENAHIGASATVGPYARLRPGAHLAERTHVGNFVEIKNSHLGKDSKAGHLAYLGDAEIGERVNVGAGTITCNYDGANKWRTIIEDDVFIGSDTQLVAPVQVGACATIGAGTTVVHDVKAGALAVGSRNYREIERWRRAKKITKTAEQAENDGMAPSSDAPKNNEER